MNNKMNWVVASLMGLMTTWWAHAAVIYQSSVSSPQGSFGDCYAIENAGNQSGLSATYISGSTDFTTFVATTTHASPLSGCNSGFTNGDASPQQFTLDMGSTVSVNGLAFWATNNSGSVTRFDLYSDTDGDFGDGGLMLVGSFTAAGPIGDINPAQVFNFASSTSRYFQINALASFGGEGFSDGIGELALRQAVPEPGTVALISVSLIGFLGVRRRTSRRAAWSAKAA